MALPPNGATVRNRMLDLGMDVGSLARACGVPQARLREICACALDGTYLGLALPMPEEAAAIQGVLGPLCTRRIPLPCGAGGVGDAVASEIDAWERAVGKGIAGVRDTVFVLWFARDEYALAYRIEPCPEAFPSLGGGLPAFMEEMALGDALDALRAQFLPTDDLAVPGLDDAL